MFFDPREGEKKQPDLSAMHSVPAQRRNEVRQRRPVKAPVRHSIFVKPKDYG